MTCLPPTAVPCSWATAFAEAGEEAAVGRRGLRRPLARVSHLEALTLAASIPPPERRNEAGEQGIDAERGGLPKGVVMGTARP